MKPKKMISDEQRLKRNEKSHNYYNTVVRPRRTATTHKIWLNQLSTSELEEELRKRSEAISNQQ